MPPPVARRHRAARAARRATRRRCGATARVHRGTYVLERVPRGPLRRRAGAGRRSRTRSGSRAARSSCAAGGALLVYPRLVALDRLFSESGAHAQDGRRLLLRRPSGFDLHSVREYEQRRVAAQGALAHDRAARPADGEGARGRAARRDRGPARRGRAAPSAGESFDVAGARGGLDPARARGPRPPRRRSRSTRRRGRARASPRSTATGSPRSSCSRRAEPDGTRPVVELLARESGPAARALETVVVTARLSGALATKLVQRAPRGAGRQRRLDRRAELRGPARRRVEPELLRLQAAGRRGRGRARAATRSPPCSARARPCRSAHG